MAPNLRLHYFPMPGRAEAARILLSIGNVPFEDVTFTKQQFPEFKAKYPFGQVPALEVDGKLLAQSTAIDRYIAKLVGLYPEDPWEAALADQAVAAFQEAVFDVFCTWYLYSLPLEQRPAANAEVVAGPVLRTRLQNVNRLVEAAGDGFLVGGKLTFADIVGFTYLSWLVSEYWPGVPKTVLDEFPALKAFRSRIASLPQVQAYVAKYTDGSRACLQP